MSFSLKPESISLFSASCREALTQVSCITVSSLRTRTRIRSSGRMSPLTSCQSTTQTKTPFSPSPSGSQRANEQISIFYTNNESNDWTHREVLPTLQLLLLLPLLVSSFGFIAHSPHGSVFYLHRFQQQQAAVFFKVINPLYPTCPASHSRQAQLTVCWWRQWNISS